MAVTKITADFIDADAVETAKIKDDAVTLAKLAAGYVPVLSCCGANN
jgi:hypothetical protein